MRNDRILVVPDIHGRVFWRKVLDASEDLEVVFLGDYFDPYPFEDIGYSQAFQQFDDIVQFAKSREGVHLLLGNHDAHYLGMSMDTCRMSWHYRFDIYERFKASWDLFNIAWEWKNTIFTHAGIVQGWKTQRDIGEKPASCIVSWLNSQKKLSRDWVESPNELYCGDSDNPIGDIGRIRGGYAPHGSPIWADVEEMVWGSAYKDERNQVFSHTQLEKTGSFIHRDSFWMCDSREVFVYDEKSLEIYGTV